jgi:hypothetical protein
LAGTTTTKDISELERRAGGGVGAPATGVFIVAIKKVNDARPGGQSFEPSYSIVEFCRVEGISKPTYFLLRARGLGPEEMRYPGMRIVRITHRARETWQRKMSSLSGKHAEETRATAEHLRNQALDAAKLAVKSPRHVSNLTQAQRARQKRAAAGRRQAEVA